MSDVKKTSADGNHHLNYQFERTHLTETTVEHLIKQKGGNDRLFVVLIWKSVYPLDYAGIN